MLVKFLPLHIYIDLEVSIGLIRAEGQSEGNLSYTVSVVNMGMSGVEILDYIRVRSICETTLNTQYKLTYVVTRGSV